jgi:ZIP family zinc transporter
MAARAWPPRWRLLMGGVICALGPLLLLRDLDGALAALAPGVRGALHGGLLAALATAAGTLPVLLAQRFSQRGYDAFLGLGAGIMLAATAFSLVLPALAACRQGGSTPLLASVVVGAGILCGMALVMLLDRLVPTRLAAPAGSAPAAARQAVSAATLRRAWLFVAAVSIHNLPEGLAIGVAYAGVDPAKAHGLATATAPAARARWCWALS